MDGDSRAECCDVREEWVVYMRGEQGEDVWVMSREFVGGLSI
jgi:hypothetical protein